MSVIYPVLLAGGSGIRLWPLSRKSFPKQFSNLMGDSSLFQMSVQRLISSEIIKFSPPTILTNSDFRFIIAEQLQEIGIDPGPILIEPQAKNTAAAILAASLLVYSKVNDAILLVAPSDHVIPEPRDFHETVKAGLAHVESRKLVTFGIKPSHPETGYGYLEVSNSLVGNNCSSDVTRFVEKPNFNDAKKMLESGRYLWNSGMFLFRAKDMIDAFSSHAPKTLEIVSKAVNEASPDLGFLRLASDPWSRLDEISVDYAIMEKAQNLVAVCYGAKWSDVGSWNSVWSECEQDTFGNVVSETALAFECSNSLLRADSSNQQIVGIGLDNIIAVATPDAVLVANKDRAQDVKKAVEFLKLRDIPQANTFPKEHRPWGWFERLALGDRFQVKRIYVKPGGALSLQSHKFRSEHWVVVEGTAKITINENVGYFTEGKSVFVPLGAKHRLENEGESAVILIEVQIGDYLGEDDIIRYEDVYAR